IAGEPDRMKFFVSNACKDMTYFKRLTDAVDLQTPVATVVRDSIDHAVAAGFGDRFMTGLIDAQLALNGLPPTPWDSPPGA
ncbi:MAG: hypothetical protein KIT73_15030, partial [Burkholderiales bacterium]|nr:hypothetical protein [Burkholderiales bacterium]